MVIFAYLLLQRKYHYFRISEQKGNHPVKEISLGLRKTIEHAKGCQAFLSERLENADAEPFLYEGVLSQHNTPKEGENILKKLLGEKKLSS